MDHTIVYFEIPARDVEKLRKFYTGLFGWKIEKGSTEMSGGMDYWLIETVPVDEKMNPIRPGVNGGMYRRTDQNMKQINYISVESADDFTAKVKKLGGKIIVPKMEVPKVGGTVLAEDPEGNQVAALQPMMNP